MDNNLNQPFSELPRRDVSYILNTTKVEISEARKTRGYAYFPAVSSGSQYFEFAFLSSVMAGAEIPEVITRDHFRRPWNKIIFEALCSIRHIRDDPYKKYDLLIGLLSKNPRFDESFRKYTDEIFYLTGVPGNVSFYAERLIMSKAGLPV